MHQHLINFTRSLFNTACHLAKTKTIGFVPYPEKPFKNNDDLFKYLNILNKYIKHPELSYLDKNLNKLKIKKQSSIYLDNKFFF